MSLPSRAWTHRLFIGSVSILLGITFAQATPDEVPCGTVTKSGKGVQLIPHQGAVLSKLVEDAPVACESMVITHQEPLWIKLADQTQLKIAPQSFVEIPKSGSAVYRVYRGQVLISAPPGITTQIWSTPNSELVFKGGVGLIDYQASNRLTTVSCFNREFQFRNKFNNEAQTTVHAGEMSHLAIQEATVNPSTPVVMNQASVSQALAGLKLESADQGELVAVVKRVYQDRSKSLTSEIQDWEGIEKKEEVTGPSRSIASEKGVAPPQPALDVKEGEFVNRMMREHIYDEEPARKPASAHVSEELVDSEKQIHQTNLKKEKKRIEKEIDHIQDSE